MGPVLRLEILLRVPVRVEEDDGVGGHEVDSLATGAGAEEEELVVFVGVEGFDLGAAVFLADGAVDAAAVPGAELRGPVLEDVELGFELGEDEDFVALVEKAGN